MTVGSRSQGSEKLPISVHLLCSEYHGCFLLCWGIQPLHQHCLMAGSGRPDLGLVLCTHHPRKENSSMWVLKREPVEWGIFKISQGDLAPIKLNKIHQKYQCLSHISFNPIQGQCIFLISFAIFLYFRCIENLNLQKLKLLVFPSEV